jgi:hypothetical protein
MSVSTSAGVIAAQQSPDSGQKKRARLAPRPDLEAGSFDQTE